MSKILVFDTETSGLPFGNYAATHPKFARVMSLAAILYDEELNAVNVMHTLISIPEHTHIEEAAFKAHGIKMDDCKNFGVPFEIAIMMFDQMLKQSTIQVAHNIAFDTKMLISNANAYFNESVLAFPNTFCTMQNTTELCKIPKDNGYKWPKLEEAYNHFFPGETFEAHDAFNDVMACARIFKELIKLDGTILASNDLASK